MDITEIKKLTSIINYTFKDSTYLDVIFLHNNVDESLKRRKVMVKDIAQDILNLYLKRKIYDYVITNDKDVSLVNEYLAKASDTSFIAKNMQILGLHLMLVLSEEETKKKVYNMYSLSYDLALLLIGSVAQDCSFNNLTLKTLIDYILDLDYNLQHDFKIEENYKEKLFKQFKDKKIALPKYIFNVNAIAYNGASLCSLSIENVSRIFSARGESKSIAANKAAEMAYNYLKEHNLLSEINSFVQEIDISRSVNTLQEMHFKGYIDEPIYDLEEVTENNNTFWKVKLHIDSLNLVVEEQGQTKKEAKKKAAYDMLTKLASL